MPYRRTVVAFFYALGLLLAAEANAFSLFNKDHAAVPASAVSSRQLTRSRLVSRLERKASLEAHRKAHGRALVARQSQGQFETCSSANAGAGYAEYINYNAPGNNLGAIETGSNVQTPAGCAELCRSFGDQCIGFSFEPNWNNNGPACSPKQNLGAAVASLAPSRWSTWLKGSCGEFSGSTSATCCNSAVNPGTTCSSITIGVAGWSEYKNYNSAGNNLEGFNFNYKNPGACRRYCESKGDQCVGFAFNQVYNGGACSLKTNRAGTLSGLKKENPDWTTWVRGSCSSNNSGTSATCCNTVAAPSYPTCSTSDPAGPGAGYARYDTYNIWVNSLAPIQTSNSPANCAAACQAYGSACEAFVWASSSGGRPACQLKSNATGSSTVLRGGSEWNAYLRGQCSDYAGNAGSAACCNTAPRTYPTCSAAVSLSGYAFYDRRNIASNSIGNIIKPISSRGACQQRCASQGSQCVAFVYDVTNAQCQLKSNATGSAYVLSDSSNWSSYITGRCEDYSASAYNGCCNPQS